MQQRLHVMFGINMSCTSDNLYLSLPLINVCKKNNIYDNMDVEFSKQYIHINQILLERKISYQSKQQWLNDITYIFCQCKNRKCVRVCCAISKCFEHSEAQVQQSSN